MPASHCSFVNRIFMTTPSKVSIPPTTPVLEKQLKQPLTMKKSLLSIVLLTTLFGAIPSLHAQSPTWRNTGTDFNTAANWNPSALPTSIAIFDGAAVAQPNLSSNITINRLTFNATATGYTVSASVGAAFTLNSSSAISSVATSGFNVISAPIVLGAASNSTQSIGGSVAGHALVITGSISSTNTNVSLISSGAGPLFLLGANTYTGQTVFFDSTNLGPIVINSIGNVGAGASSLGAPTTAANGTIKINGGGAIPVASVRYIGGVAATDRNIEYFTTLGTTAFTLEASGSGALTWNGNLLATGNSTTGKNFWLSGVNSANNTFAGSISNNSGNGAATELIKNGAGTWVLSGNNSFTGGITINGGTLELNYQRGAVIDSTNIVYFGNPISGTGIAPTTIPTSGGTLKLVGKTSGTTSQTLGNPTFGSGQARIVIDPNGGDGTTLTLGNTWSRSVLQGLLYIELPTGATLTSNPTVTNGLIAGSSKDPGYAVVKDGTGVGFATVSGGNVVRYTGATDLTATSNNGTTNYKSSGNLTLAAGTHSLNSLDINTTGGGTLDLNGTTAYVSGLLFTGTGDYTISNGTIGKTDSTGNNAFHVQQFSTGLVSISALNSGTNAGLYVFKGGPGTVAVTTRGGAGTMKIYEGAIRADGATVISAGAIQLSTGGVLELGAAGNFTGALGTAAGNVQFTGDGGFSAYDATNTGVVRTVQIGGNTNTIAWGATNFVPNDNALVLSNVKSNTTVDFQNGLNLGMQQHVVQVNKGTAAVDATLSGVLSGNYGGGLIKEGAGTLSITGNSNTYIGETWVNAGTLLVNGNQSAATGAVKVNGGTLGGNGTIGASVTVNAGGTLSPGNSPGVLTVNGTLTLAGNTLMEVASGTHGTNYDGINIGDGQSLTYGGNLTLTMAGSVAIGTYDLFSSVTTLTPLSYTGNFSSIVFADGGFYSGTFSRVGDLWTSTLTGGRIFTFDQASGDLIAAVPEPATWALLAFSLTTVLVLRRRRRD